MTDFGGSDDKGGQKITVTVKPGREYLPSTPVGGSDEQCQSMCCKEDVDVDCILELDHDGPHDDGTGWEW